MLSFGLIMLTSILVGILAQSWKERTGAAWGFVAFLAILFLWVLTYWGVIVNSPQTLDIPTGWLGVTLTACLFGGGAVALIVATLPRRYDHTAPRPEKGQMILHCDVCGEEMPFAKHAAFIAHKQGHV